MDNDDYQAIIEHLKIIDENNHHTINAVNEQVHISAVIQNNINKMMYINETSKRHK